MRINYIKHDSVKNMQALTKKNGGRGHLGSNWKIKNEKNIF